MKSLDKMDLLRYKRQFILDEIGIAGQKKLKNTSVLCVGAGGLGSPLLLYLAACGIGTLGIIDDDIVDLTNLQRQILYSSQDIKQKKVNIAREKLININPALSVNIYDEKLNSDNALEIIKSYDYVADCADNYVTRYVINDACYYLKKTFIHAGIYQFEGHCTLFDVHGSGSPCYRCLFPTPPAAELLPNCSEAGVLGVLPGIIGCIQATELIKKILNIGEFLSGMLFIFDALTMESNKVQISKRRDCILCVKNTPYSQLPRNEEIVCTRPISEVKKITCKNLYELLSQKTDRLFLLDVREEYEYKDFNLGGYLSPLAELPNLIGKLDSNTRIIIYCKSGRRSEAAAIYLKEYGFKNVLSLQDGILGWLESMGTFVPQQFVNPPIEVN